MFTVILEQEELSVDPGATVKVPILVQNKGEATARFALEVEGLDLDWCAIPVPAFTLEPNEETRERILIKPPRSSESRAGVYPFVVTVRNLETGEKVSKQGSVAVSSFNLLTIELNPKRGTVTPASKATHFDTIVANLGNTEQHLQLYASDPDDGCTYQFEEERVTLPPGSQKDIPLTAQATSVPVIATPRLYGFSVSARSIENTHVFSGTQGQIERRGLFSPATLFSLLTLVILTVAGFLLWPRPARVLEFDVTPASVTQGEDVTVSWRTDHANSVRLVFEGQQLEKLDKPSGTFTFTPPRSGRLTISAEGSMGQVVGPEKTITVTAKPAAATPEFVEFKVSPTQVRPDQPVTIHWVVRNATKVVITPLNLEYEPFIENVDVTFNRSGPYELVAVNSEGKTVKKKFTITVNTSDAEIVTFKAVPAELPLDGGTVTLSWELRNAAEATINGVGSVAADAGTAEVTVDKTTMFTLEAKDTLGRPIVKKVIVKVAAPPPNPANGQ